MKKRERTVSVSIATLLALAFSGPASADDSQFYGLLRERDLTTFGFLRLDMRPSHAVSIETGRRRMARGAGRQGMGGVRRLAHDAVHSLRCKRRSYDDVIDRHGWTLAPPMSVRVSSHSCN
jgi:hypothetical protein